MLREVAHNLIHEAIKSGNSSISVQVLAEFWVTLMYSEDLQDGAEYEGILVRNPFGRIGSEPSAHPLPV